MDNHKPAILGWAAGCNRWETCAVEAGLIPKGGCVRKPVWVAISCNVTVRPHKRHFRIWALGKRCLNAFILHYSPEQCRLPPPPNEKLAGVKIFSVIFFQWLFFLTFEKPPTSHVIQTCCGLKILVSDWCVCCHGTRKSVFSIWTFHSLECIFCIFFFGDCSFNFDLWSQTCSSLQLTNQSGLWTCSHSGDWQV